MARDDEHRAEARGGFLTAALVVLCATTGAAFGRLFAGSGSSWRLLAAGAAAAGLAALLERQHLAVSLLAGAAGLVVALGVLVFPQTTLFGIPTPETISSLERALRLVGRQAAEEYTPAAPHASLVGAALIAVWCASHASHALAARSGSPILALLPPAGLLGFAGYLAGDGPRRGYALAFLGAALAVLFGSGLRRLRSWGPILRWPGARPLRIAGGPSGREARRLGLAVSAAALLLPGLLPGFGAQPLIDLEGGTGRRVRINPIVDIRPNLLQNPATELFTVVARRPAYWRMVTLDRFAGRTWTSDDLEGKRADVVSGPSPLVSSIPSDAQFLDQRFEIGDLATPWLPAAHQPVAISVPGNAETRYDGERETVVRPAGVPRGFRYRAVSQLIVPAPESLDRVTIGDPIDMDPELIPYTQLPPLPPRIARIAREIVRTETTMYRQVLALQRYLRRFTYDERAPAGHGVNDMLFFLEKSRRGYCEQFAGTMGVLARVLGYPARVAVGFLPGTRGRDGAFHVTTKEAHAWTEVFFPGHGWLAFEPTPTRSNPVAGDYNDPPTAVAGLPITQGEVALTQGVSSAAAQREAAERVQQQRDAAAGRENAKEAARPRRPTALLILLAAPAWLLAAAGWRAVRRRVWLVRARSPRHAVIGAFRAFESAAGELRLGRLSGETLREYAERLRSTAHIRRARLERMAALGDLAMYSTRAVGREDAAEAASLARRLVRELRRRAGAARTVAGALRPRRGPVAATVRTSPVGPLPEAPG